MLRFFFVYALVVLYVAFVFVILFFISPYFDASVGLCFVIVAFLVVLPLMIDYNRSSVTFTSCD